MTIRTALGEAATALSAVSSSPSLDAGLLLCRALGTSRERLLAAYAEELAPDALAAFRELLGRRASGESVSYILGRREFRGLDFMVDARVLSPRPDTETLVEAALELIDGLSAVGRGTLRIHDAFTGSGAVGIALAAERPARVDVSLSDISRDALDLAAENGRRLLGEALEAFHADCLSGIEGPFDLIVANPPYVTSGLCDEIEASGGREPRLALDGGLDGLDLYRRLAPRAFALLAPGGFLAVEIGEEQGAAVAGLLKDAGFAATRVRRDLAGHDRVVEGARP